VFRGHDRPAWPRDHLFSRLAWRPPFLFFLASKWPRPTSPLFLLRPTCSFFFQEVGILFTDDVSRPPTSPFHSPFFFLETAPPWAAKKIRALFARPPLPRRPVTPLASIRHWSAFSPAGVQPPPGGTSGRFGLLLSPPRKIDLFLEEFP